MSGDARRILQSPQNAGKLFPMGSPDASPDCAVVQFNQIRPHQALSTRPVLPETLIKNGTELLGLATA